MLPALISLGVWQTQRGDEKAALQLAYYDKLGMLPVAPGPELDAFTVVRLRGEFKGRQFLVDNQVRDGQVGYWVIEEFKHINGERFLVNRGFLAGAQDRTVPSVPDPAVAVPVTVLATVWPDLGLPPIFSEDPWPEGRWPLVVQRKEIPRMAARIDARVLELRLHDGEPGALKAISQHVDFGEATHRGYAFQWFALATVLLAGYLYLWFRWGKRDVG